MKNLISKLIGKQASYDLPFLHDGSARFLLLVIAIMVFLATLTLNAGMQLSAITKSLSDGVVNKATVEILPDVEVADFNIDDEAVKVLNFLRSSTAVKKAELLEHSEIKDMLAPWVGSNISDESMPLPRIISVEFLDQGKGTDIISERLSNVSDHARLDTHDGWVNSILTLSGSLKAVAFIIITVITIAMVAMVGSGIHARIQIYKDEVELLHLIGARDIYVAKQFQKHAFWISLKAAFIGFVTGSIFYYATLFLISKVMSFESGSSFSFYYFFASFLGFLLFVIAISVVTARITVLRSLAKLP